MRTVIKDCTFNRDIRLSDWTEWKEWTEWFRMDRMDRMD